MTRFQTTRWSLIEAARDHPAQARAALDQLCRAYRPPVLAFVRHHGYDANSADDLTQAFFARFLELGWYSDADPQRGRFRSLLLTQVRRFLISQHKADTAQKRSGQHLDMDVLEHLASDGETPEQAFTRVWMDTAVSRAMARLQREWERAGKREQFEQLSSLLLEQADSAELHALSTETGMRPNTLSVQAHRLRQRLRQLVRLELLQTVGSREALDEELADLRSTLRGSAP